MSPLILRDCRGDTYTLLRWNRACREHSIETPQQLQVPGTAVVPPPMFNHVIVPSDCVQPVGLATVQPKVWFHGFGSVDPLVPDTVAM